MDDFSKDLTQDFNVGEGGSGSNFGTAEVSNNVAEDFDHDFSFASRNEYAAIGKLHAFRASHHSNVGNYGAAAEESNAAARCYAAAANTYEGRRKRKLPPLGSVGGIVVHKVKVERRAVQKVEQKGLRKVKRENDHQ